MDDQELKQAWQQLALDQEKVNYQSQNLSKNMESEINTFERRINARDRREIFVAACMLLAMIVLAIFQDGYQRIGATLFIGYFGWIIYYLTQAKVQKPAFSIAKSVKEQLVDYRAYVVLQRNLVKNVLYWYLLPIVPGMLVMYLGMSSGIAMAMAIILSFLSFYYVHRLNQRAAKENYDPLLKELSQAIEGLEL